MKKLRQLLAIAAMALTVFSAQAQSEVVFNPHLNLRLQGGAGYTIGETSFSNLISPAAALSVGYQFTPVFGLRLGASGWQGRGGMSLMEDAYKFNYIQGNLDATFDLANLIGGYKADRLFSPYILVGAGLNNSFNNDEAIAINASGTVMTNLWEGNKLFAVGRAGIGTDIRLAEKVAFNIEVNTNIISDHFNSKDAPNSDWQFNALAGLTFKFGQTSKTITKSKPAPKAAESKPAPKPAPKPEPVKEKPAPVVTKKSETVNVFFNLDSSKINSSETSKIDELTDYLKSNPSAKVTLTGYADANTGNTKYNQGISEKRTTAVREALIANGISESRISTTSKGDTVQPFSDNDKNRVVVCVAQ